MPGTDGGCGARPDRRPGRTAGDGRCLRWRNTLTEIGFQLRREINFNPVLKQGYREALNRWNFYTGQSLIY